MQTIVLRHGRQNRLLPQPQRVCVREGRACEEHVCWADHAGRALIHDIDILVVYKAAWTLYLPMIHKWIAVPRSFVLAPEVPRHGLQWNELTR